MVELDNKKQFEVDVSDITRVRTEIGFSDDFLMSITKYEEVYEKLIDGEWVEYHREKKV